MHNDDQRINKLRLEMALDAIDFMTSRQRQKIQVKEAHRRLIEAIAAKEKTDETSKGPKESVR